jgi:hypothetical protein
MQQQDTELTGAGEGGSGPAPPPPDVTTPPVNGEPAEPPGAEEVERGGDPEEATTHHSSGYASSDSSGVGGGPAAATTPLSEGTPPIAAQQQLPAAAGVLPVSIQSDPQQSAFRPAMPAQQVCMHFVGYIAYMHDRKGPSCSYSKAMLKFLRRKGIMANFFTFVESDETIHLYILSNFSSV